MFKNKSADGRRNLCGPKVKTLRKARKWSQRELADQLQLHNIDVGKNAVQQIESGERFVTDIELKGIAVVFEISLDDLMA